MTSPHTPRRPWWVHLFVGAAIMALLFAVIFLVIRNLSSSNDAAQDSAVTSAPQEQKPDYPDFPSPQVTEPTEEPSASAMPSVRPTPKIPKGGDERGCPTGKPGKMDADDPFCKERERREAYKKYFAANPAYDCPDNRNSGLGIDNQDEFVPCINGALRLELVSGSGYVTLYSSTTTSASVEHKVSNKAKAPKPGVTGVDWVIRQSTFGTDELGEFYRLRYFANPDLQLYGVYYRVGMGSYELLKNPNNRKFYTDTYYQVVVFWNNPELPRQPEAPLPPFFAWGDVEKPASS